MISHATLWSRRHSTTTSERVAVCENSCPDRLCLRVASRKTAFSRSPAGGFLFVAGTLAPSVCTFEVYRTANSELLVLSYLSVCLSAQQRPRPLADMPHLDRARARPIFEPEHRGAQRTSSNN